MHEVDECESLPALRLQVLRQVEVVVLPLELFVKQLEHVGLTKLYRYVSNHQSRLLLYLCVVIDLRINDALEINLIAFRANQNFLFVA